MSIRFSQKALIALAALLGVGAYGSVLIYQRQTAGGSAAPVNSQTPPALVADAPDAAAAPSAQTKLKPNADPQMSAKPETAAPNSEGAGKPQSALDALKAKRRADSAMKPKMTALTAPNQMNQPRDSGARPPMPSAWGNGPRRFGMGGRRELSLAQIPVSALTPLLKLNASQKTKIQAVQDDLMKQREALMPRRDASETPPDRDAMRAGFEKMQAMRTQADKDITAVLTADQQKALPALLKEFMVLRMAGVSPELYSALRLTASQHQQIAALGELPPQELRAKVTALLTAEQQKAVAAYQTAHPRSQRGAPGGYGGYGGERGPRPNRPGGSPDGQNDAPPPPPGE